MQRVTDLIRHILFKHHGVLVLNYIDDIIGIAPDSVADVHFKITLNLLNSLGFILSNSKTISPSKIPTCLGINFNISLGTMHIPLAKLQDVITLCQKYLNLKFITKNGLQALIGSLIYIHKAVKPARIFVNRILTLLRNMGSARRVAIDRGTKRDLRWFIACAHAVNETVFIHKELRSRVHITVDASLQNLGGALGNRVYRLQIGYKPGWSIAHWEAVNILVALRTWAKFVRGKSVAIWCDNSATVSVCSTGRGRDPTLNAIVRNLWLFQAQHDCHIAYHHIRGQDNVTADLLSRWDTTPAPLARLYQLLNNIPIWDVPPPNALFLDYNV
jgi:hypothetical protein